MTCALRSWTWTAAAWTRCWSRRCLKRLPPKSSSRSNNQHDESFSSCFCLVQKYLTPTVQRVGLTLPTNHGRHAKISTRKQRRSHMKNKKYLFVPFLLVILISGLFAAVQVKPALAQEQCLDAAGGPIPCPT